MHEHGHHDHPHPHEHDHDHGCAQGCEHKDCAACSQDPKAELLAVHDGARPLVRPEDFDEMIRLGGKTYAVAPALPVSDTIKVADASGLVQSTPERASLYAVQTPQVFQANLLRAALQSALTCGAELTDDCSAVERLLTDGIKLHGDDYFSRLDEWLEGLVVNSEVRAAELVRESVSASLQNPVFRLLSGQERLQRIKERIARIQIKKSEK